MGPEGGIIMPPSGIRAHVLPANACFSLALVLLPFVCVRICMCTRTWLSSSLLPHKFSCVAHLYTSPLPIYTYTCGAL